MMLLVVKRGLRPRESMSFSLRRDVIGWVGCVSVSVAVTITVVCKSAHSDSFIHFTLQVKATLAGSPIFTSIHSGKQQKAAHQ